MCEHPKKIHCHESLFPEPNSICLSPKYSAHEQAVNLERHLIEKGFNSHNSEIHLVDFGGDILTDGLQSSIISPELDAFSLAVVRQMKSFRSKLLVMFPGVDGELDAKYLRFCCESRATDNYPFDKIFTERLEEVYEIVKVHRPGNTIPNMLKVLRKELNNIKLTKNWIRDGKKITYTTVIDLDYGLQEQIWEFNIQEVSEQNPFTRPFLKSDYSLLLLLETILKIYSNQAEPGIQLSDLFLQYLRKDSDEQIKSFRRRVKLDW
ncbi:Domain of unknown function (DUF1152)-containing protein [uncultured virus]|nr:Domain of unknown function (DUF1152)-containing protein [uncultured virus]